MKNSILFLVLILTSLCAAQETRFGNGTPVTEITQATYDGLTTEQKANLGLSIGKPVAVPSGYAVVFGDDPVLANGSDSLVISSITRESFQGDVLPLWYDFSISSSGGGSPVTGNGDIPKDATTTHTITGVDLSGLPDGTLTATLYLTNTLGAGANATDTALKGASLLPAPLASNPNPELVTGNGLSFTAESAGTSGVTPSGSVTVSAPTVDDGYVGNLVLQSTTTGTFQTWTYNPSVTALADEVFEYAILIRRTGSAGGGVCRVRIGGTIIATHTLSTSGVFTLYTGTVSNASGGALDFQFLQQGANDVFDTKLSFKRQ